MNRASIDTSALDMSNRPSLCPHSRVENNAAMDPLEGCGLARVVWWILQESVARREYALASEERSLSNANTYLKGECK